MSAADWAHSRISLGKKRLLADTAVVLVEHGCVVSVQEPPETSLVVFFVGWPQPGNQASVTQTERSRSVITR